MKTERAVVQLLDLELLALAVTEPMEPEVLCFVLDASGRGSTLFVVDDIHGPDAVLDVADLLASGASGVAVGAAAPAALRALFQEALDRVCFALAEKIVGDGEKITKVVAVEIEGARTRADAEKIARAIGNSLLVKSSWFGEDPNWGRLADAAGYARTGLDESKLDIFYDDVPAGPLRLAARIHMGRQIAVHVDEAAADDRAVLRAVAVQHGAQHVVGADRHLTVRRALTGLRQRRPRTLGAVRGPDVNLRVDDQHGILRVGNEAWGMQSGRKFSRVQSRA